MFKQSSAKRSSDVVLRRVLDWNVLHTCVLWRRLPRIWNAGALVFYFSPLEWSRSEVAEIGESGIDRDNLARPPAPKSQPEAGDLST